MVTFNSDIDIELVKIIKKDKNGKIIEEENINDKQ